MYQYSIEQRLKIGVCTHPDMAEVLVDSMLDSAAAELNRLKMSHYLFSAQGNKGTTRANFTSRLADEIVRLHEGRPPYRSGRSKKTEHAIEESYLKGLVEWVGGGDNRVMRVRITLYATLNPD